MTLFLQACSTLPAKDNSVAPKKEQEGTSVNTDTSKGNQISSPTETTALIEKAAKLIKEKGDAMEALDTYKKLMAVLPKGDKNRENLLKYIMDASMEMVRSNDVEKIQKGIQIALGIDGIEAGDFYVQNRLIYGYTSLAKLEAAKKNWTIALDWTQKALMLHFDSEAMRERLVIQTEQAKEAVAKGNKDEATKILTEVVGIMNLKDNKSLYAKELKIAQDLMASISR